ncbi:MAG: molybdenum cofactor biosynthesis protein MoaE [Candidatus Limnocylindrales bacterium]
MRVRVRLFAIQRELAGTRELGLDLPAAATVGDAWDALVSLHPVLAPGRSSVRFARNGVYAAAEELLADGDEVAMIPPVSGGAARDAADDVAADAGAADAGAEAPSIRILELRKDPFEADLVARLTQRLATPADGAVVTFLGITRSSPGTPAPGQEVDAARHAGSDVEALDYEALEPMALEVMSAIADEIQARFGVRRLAMVHRTGSVPLGDASVAIVACAPHRADAFAAASYAIDEIKARAPIWKAEQFADGHVWIGSPARDGPPEDPRQ